MASCKVKDKWSIVKAVCRTPVCTGNCQRLHSFSVLFRIFKPNEIGKKKAKKYFSNFTLKASLYNDSKSANTCFLMFSGSISNAWQMQLPSINNYQVNNHSKRKYAYSNPFLRATSAETKAVEKQIQQHLTKCWNSRHVKASLLSLSCMTSMLGTDDMHDDLWVE